VFCGLAFLAIPTKAADVRLSVTIKERRPSDTINDFVFKTVNPNGQGKIYL
jgi:hypothetical protein